MDDVYENRISSHDNEIVLLKDERSHVENTTLAPFRWICSLEVEFPEPVLYPLGTLEHPGKSWRNLKPTRKGCGSGILISPKHILTASHVIAGLKVVKDKKTGQSKFKLIRAKKVTVIPGRNDNNIKKAKPFGIFISQKLFISPKFQSALELPVSQLTKAQIRRALGSDFGIIEVKDKMNQKIVIPGQSSGWWREFPKFKIQAVDKMTAEIKDKQVYVCGFPGEKGNTPCSTMWQSFDKVIKIFPKSKGKIESLIFYQADTSAGMSGSPVWIKDRNGNFSLIAVHSSFLNVFDRKTKGKRMVNVGALITAETIRQFRKWGVGYMEILLLNQK